jgi:tRNA-5-methyluridine54 2-sulfurtransferase
MKCKKCNKKAVHLLTGFCKDHFIQYFEKKVYKTIKDYNLVEKKDRVVVAVSGGKDSLSVLYLLSQKYDVVALGIDEGIKGYRDDTIVDLKRFCEKYGIELKIVSIKDEFGFTLDLVLKKVEDKPCTVCGAIRRYMINKYARELGATKLATGHNLDDEAQSVLMNLFRNQQEISARLGPITGIIKDERFIPRIKPLYFLSEKEVTVYALLMKFGVGFIECPYSVESYRNTIADLLNDYEQKNPGTKNGIIKSFLNMLPDLKKKYASDEKPNTCAKCGEPSKQKLCRVCQLLEKVK